MKPRSGWVTDYDVGDKADQRREGRVTRAWLPVSLGLIASGVFIAITIVNMLASGIPNEVTGTSAWDSDQPFPMIPLPSWITILVGCLPLLTTVLIWRNVDERHGPLLSNTLTHFCTVFLLLPLVFAGTYPEPSPFANGDRTWGWHWIGSVIVLVAILAMIIRRVTLRRTDVPQREPDPFTVERVDLIRKAKTNRKIRETLDERLLEVHAREAASKARTTNATETDA
ncbi:hypothetical protein ASE14_11515 [Agromyces sp. Root81]|uniref:hypothetical protein n=1 Tax=Agromyces sp. Root81 TaxID=1736601 RepID=UPI0006F9FF86|nr:hypothetical protein [Agromyces sp. Root81]KRC61486.1 hypothetical protein ASE14_11515 [Agromyces sp. Root81]